MRPSELAARWAPVAACCAAMIAMAAEWSRVATRVYLGSDDGIALLAVAGCLWVLWRGRAALHLGAGGWSARALAVASVAACWLGSIFDWGFVAQAGGLALAPALAGLLLDRAAAAVLARAVVALLFALPIPGVVVEHVGLPLQVAEARAVELLALLLDFDVVRDGVLLVLEGTPVRVDEGCSGFTLLWPVLLAVWLAADGVIARPAHAGGLRWVPLVLLAVPTLLLGNFLRLFATVCAYAFADAETAVRIHDALGWCLVLAVGAAPFVLLDPDAAQAPLVPPAGSRDPVPPRAGVAPAFLLLALALAPQLLMPAPLADAAALDRRLAALPWRLDELVGARRSLPERELEVLGADAVVHRAYVDLDSGQEVLFVAAWHGDAAAAAGHGAEKCYRARGWRSTRVESLEGGRFGADTRRFLFDRPGARITVFESVLDGPVPAMRLSADADPGGGGGRLRILIVLDGDRRDAPARDLVGRFLAALDLVATGGTG